MTPLPDLDTVATPALVADGRRLVANVAAMADRAREAGVELWPHTKTHKSVAIANLQREYGIGGVTVATVREAETFAAAGFEDILVAHPPVGDWRLDRLTALARDGVRLRVVLDGADTAELLDSACRRSGVTIGYLWEVDSGVARCGTIPGPATVEAIARTATRTRCARFGGVMSFAGHAYAAASTDEIGAIAEAEGLAVRETAAALAERDVEAAATSVGTTPTSHHLDRQGPVDEIRPGNYVFYDATQVTLELVPKERCALSVLATVVSRPDPRRLILDAGSKALAAERLTSRSPGFGFVEGHDDLVVERLYEEHAIVTAREPSPLPIGTRLRVVPNHACASANLHARMLVVEDDAVVDAWEVDARGWDPVRVGAAEASAVR